MPADKGEIFTTSTSMITEPTKNYRCGVKETVNLKPDIFVFITLSDVSLICFSTQTRNCFITCIMKSITSDIFFFLPEISLFLPDWLVFSQKTKTPDVHFRVPQNATSFQRTEPMMEFSPHICMVSSEWQATFILGVFAHPAAGFTNNECSVNTTKLNCSLLDTDIFTLEQYYYW